jgi:hypothetical protein
MREQNDDLEERSLLDSLIDLTSPMISQTLKQGGHSPYLGQGWISYQNLSGPAYLTQPSRSLELEFFDGVLDKLADRF